MTVPAPRSQVIKDASDPDNVVKFFPLRWMQQQEDPAVQTRAGQGFARTPKLWNAAANDEVMQLESPPKWSAGKVNGEITAYEVRVYLSISIISTICLARGR